ncbi:MAG: hypothetical protein LJE69_15715 [Thiohalocapsa sp.]|jgi:hypothetical protein|uniref:hypothetical protein n=1 Tax=Thiohalocapsa sp. TaxID=2497641 RepID=UPI0025E33185|nr:hypothetical protein [Thiohalocapsa sp.]MCG6942687.1 hypothetical protein [Thiohalocapsa sp.]
MNAANYAGANDKYTLGTELRNKSCEIVSQIIRANAERDKAPKLAEPCGKLDELFVHPSG